MFKYKHTIALLLIMTIVIVYSCKTQFSTTKASYTANTSNMALERGRVLVYSTCAGCHYNRAVKKFIGNQIEDVPGIVGKVYSANLTHSKTNGIAPKYSDAELKYLLKTGIARDGRFISYMLRPNMAEEDLNAIIVFLRSNDPAVAAADTTVGITHYNIIGKTYMNATAKPLPYKTIVKRPSENEPVALGAYLIDNLGCFHCHSKSLTKLNYLNPEQSKGYLAGGEKLKGERGMSNFAANITPDKQTGIGEFTQKQFLRAVKDGEAPLKKLYPPMPKYDRLSDSEINAIYTYLQTVPAKYHEIKVN